MARSIVLALLSVSLLACLPKTYGGGYGTADGANANFYWRNREDPSKDPSRDAYECETIAREVVSRKYGTATAREYYMPQEQERCMNARGYEKRFIRR